jgi:hypothetical protein
VSNAHERCRKKDLEDGRHPQPSEQLDDGNENSRLDKRCEDEVLEGMRRRVAVQLPETKSPRGKVKHANDCPKERGKRQIIARKRKNEYNCRLTAREERIKLTALTHETPNEYSAEKSRL